MTTALERGEGSASRPGRSLSPGKTRYPLYRRLGGLQGRFGQVRKISPTQGFDPRTVQPVSSRYLDYAIRPLSPVPIEKSGCKNCFRKYEVPCSTLLLFLYAFRFNLYCGGFILFCSVCMSGFCNVCVCEGIVMCGCFW